MSRSCSVAGVSGSRRSDAFALPADRCPGPAGSVSQWHPAANVLAMALLHDDATIAPTKDELIGPWLRTRPWWDGEAERGPVGTFRLDDPAGEVGMECFLLGSASGSTLFVPVTYRGAPLAGAADRLVGTMEHSVLGQRWVYDAAGDPVFVATVLDTIRTGGRQADLHLRSGDGTETVREPRTTARGEGVATVPSHDPSAPVAVEDRADRTVVRAGDLSLTVVRRLGEAPDGPAMTGSFEGGNALRLVVVDH